MAHTRLPKNLPEILRSYGLKVVVSPGWYERGRPESTGDFDPVGVLCHHTATTKSVPTSNVVNLLAKGRADLPGPLSQTGLDRDGTVYLIAAGRCNHAGVAKMAGTVAGGDGNALYIGIEAFNDGRGEPWPKAQMDAYVLLCAVLSVEVTENSHKTVNGHKETSVTGKIDPRFDMDDFRILVEKKMVEITKPAPPVTPTKKPSRGKNVDEAIKALRAAKKATKSEAKQKKIQAALTLLLKIKSS